MGEARFELSMKVKIPLERFYIYPGINVIADAVSREPSAPIEIWVQKSENDLEHLKGTSSEILQTLSYRVLDQNLDSLEVYGDRFVFFKMQRPIDIRSFGNVLRGASMLTSIGIANIISKGYSAKRAFSVISWVGRGLRGAEAVSVAAATAPTPEKGALPVWAIELGVIVVIQVVTEITVNYIEYRMEKSEIKKSLMKDLKAYEENQSSPASALTETVEQRLRENILRKFEELFFFMNKDSKSLYTKYQGKILSLAEKLKKKRESERKIDEETFNYSLPIGRSSIFGRVEKNRIRLDDFEIRIPLKGIREYQNLRKTKHDQFKNYDQLSEDDLYLLFKGERFLRDAYYLYVDREKYDKIVAQAGFDFLTPLNEKAKWGIGSLGVNYSLAENLRREFWYSKYILNLDYTTAEVYSKILNDNELPDNVFDLMLVEYAFVDRVVKNQKNPSVEFVHLKEKMADRLNLATDQQFSELAGDLFRNILTSWDQIYLNYGVGIDELRALDLRNQLPPEFQSDQDEIWTQANFSSLLQKD